MATPVKPSTDSLVAAALVPGLPHLIAAHPGPSHAALATAAADLSRVFAGRGVKRIIYYSTQWIAVLGQMFQARPDLRGVHVDENWYDLGNLPFSFQVDRPFAERMAASSRDDGFQTQLVDFADFPVDTATIVADRLLNASLKAKTAMVACNVYSDFAATVKLGAAVRRALDHDKTPTAVIGVSLLSGRFFTTDLDLREDHLREKTDDQWNLRMLGLLEKGDYEIFESLIPEYTRTCKVDMGLKAYAFVKGVTGRPFARGAKVHGYGPIYGTGGAVVEFPV